MIDWKKIRQEYRLPQHKYDDYETVIDYITGLEKLGHYEWAAIVSAGSSWSED